jgi:hypothetical protein
MLDQRDGLGQIPVVEGLHQVRCNRVALLHPVVAQLDPAEEDTGHDRAGPDDLRDVGQGGERDVVHAGDGAPCGVARRAFGYRPCMPIERCIANWHEFLAGNFEGGLDELLAEDVVFHSPIVFTPQEGKRLTKLYLTAAYGTFAGDAAPDPATGKRISSFRYTKQVLSGHHAVLEFETQLEGKYINGVDIIACDAAGRIVEFRVMLRPLQAVNLMHQKMAAMLEKMSAQPAAATSSD